MSIVYLGKRPANTYGNRAKRVRADPAPVYLGTRASAPRVAPVVAVPRGVRYPAPLRTGGFYGASVRSPMEKKVVDTAVANYAVNSTGVVTLINGEWITESKSLYFTHPNLRRGQWDGFHRPHWTSYQCCVCSGSRLLHPDYTTPPCQPQMARLMIIEDLQTNGVIATPADILQAVTVSSFMNLNNRDRFRVLREEIMTVGSFSNVATQSYAAGNQIVPINIYAKCNIPVCFEGTTGAIGSISSGAIYVFLIGNVAAGANDGVAQLSCRVRFIDA